MGSDRTVLANCPILGQTYVASSRQRGEEEKGDTTIIRCDRRIMEKKPRSIYVAYRGIKAETYFNDQARPKYVGTRVQAKIDK